MSRRVNEESCVGRRDDRIADVPGESLESMLAITPVPARPVTGLAVAVGRVQGDEDDSFEIVHRGSDCRVGYGFTLPRTPDKAKIIYSLVRFRIRPPHMP